MTDEAKKYQIQYYIASIKESADEIKKSSDHICELANNLNPDNFKDDIRFNTLQSLFYDLEHLQEEMKLYREEKYTENEN